MEVNDMAITDELVEKLTLVYLEHSCDISSMSVEEYTKKFIDLSIKVSETLKENKPKCKWVL